MGLLGASKRQRPVRRLGLCPQRKGLEAMRVVVAVVVAVAVVVYLGGQEARGRDFAVVFLWGV